MIGCPLESPGDGERLKREAHDLLETRRAVFVNRGRRALLKALLLSGTATADDVRLAVELPSEINPKCFGAVAGPLARAGIIERVGFVTTRRATGHARPVTVWELLDRTAAMQWLTAHPDAADPKEDHADDETLFDLEPTTPLFDLTSTPTKKAGAATPANK